MFTTRLCKVADNLFHGVLDKKALLCDVGILWFKEEKKKNNEGNLLTYVRVIYS